MSWKITLPPTQSVGRSVMRIENELTGANVELRGPEAALFELGTLFDAGEAALDRARQTLATGKIAYHVVFAGPKVGIDSATIALAAPGIRTTKDLERVVAALRQSLQIPDDGRLTVISWAELELPPAIEVAQAIPAGIPFPANLVS